MRAIWKGYLKFSLVTIPVSMYNAITTRRPVQFHLLHKDDMTRIKQQTVCPVDNKTLNDEDIVRGYQYGKDKYVVITDEDLAKVKKESTEAIDVVKLVDDQQIQPIYYSDSHYLVPDGKIGVDAFALIHKAMTEAQRTALAKVVMRNREHLLAIKPYNGALIAYTLHYPEEIQAVEKIEELEEIKKVTIDKNSLDMAKTLIQNMSGDFVPEEFKDEYTQTLMEIIKAKADGEEIRVEPRAERAKVISLMEALKKSVKDTEKKEVPKKAMATAGKRVKEAPIKRKKAV